MKRRILCALLALALLTAALPAGALAAKARIKFGGKVGFMYVDGQVTVKPSLRRVRIGELSWESSDEDVATVAGGKITALAEGRTVITASGGGAKAKLGVVVLPRTISLKVGGQYQLPYGTVEKYKVKNASVASIGKKGLITAKKVGTAQIQVRYKRQRLVVKVNVEAEESPTASTQVGSKAADLEAAASASQIVLVEYEKGSQATLSVHEKQNGVWKELMSCTAYVGRNGMGKVKEGDGKTPLGTYNLTTPFGIKDDPGAQMPYVKVTKYHYWCGRSSSPYYNQLVDTRVIDQPVTSSDEYLINYKGVYNYCLFIDYNAQGEAHKGSCIFLHCTGSKKSTAGCVAIPESNMKRIVQWVKPGAKIVIQ